MYSKVSDGVVSGLTKATAGNGYTWNIHPTVGVILSF
jgi:hypothetical protein